MNILYIPIGFLLLVIGGEFIVRSSVAISFKFNISKLVIGMTVVAFATSLPELIVSVNAALNGSPAIAINNVIGSNIANIGLVLGITAICTTIEVDKSFYKFYWPALLIFSLLVYFFLRNDYQLSSTEGVILFTTLLAFIILLIKKSRVSKFEIDNEMNSLSSVSNFKIIIWLIIGGISLYYGADWLVNGAVSVASQLGMSEAVISVSLVALGTSVPELAASVVAVIKKERALSLGNLIGSNIFNIGSVLGLTAIVDNITIEDPEILSRDVLWMLAFVFALLPLVIISKRNKLQLKEGFLLVLIYVFFMFKVFFS